jgi:hypothetical protein
VLLQQHSRGDPSLIQELQGHEDVSATMVDTPVLNRSSLCTQPDSVCVATGTGGSRTREPALRKGILDAGPRPLQTFGKQCKRTSRGSQKALAPLAGFSEPSNKELGELRREDEAMFARGKRIRRLRRAT